MAIAVQIQNVDVTGVGGVWVTGVLVATGNYTTGVGGDTVNFAAAIAQSNALAAINAGSFIESSQPPFNFDAWSMNGNISNGYFPVIGTNQTNCKFKVTSAFNTELGTGAYPASVTGDTIGFMAIFPKLL